MAAIIGIIKRRNSEKFCKIKSNAHLPPVVEAFHVLSAATGSMQSTETIKLVLVKSPLFSHTAKPSCEKAKKREKNGIMKKSIFLNIEENISSLSYRKNRKKAKKREFAIKEILYIIRRILYISFLLCIFSYLSYQYSSSLPLHSKQNDQDSLLFQALEILGNLNDVGQKKFFIMLLLF